MDAYYSKQITLPYFAGAARQRGSGLGSLAASILPFAVPLLKNVLFPAAKTFAKNVAVEALPNIDDALQGKTSIKKAAKRTLSKAAIRSIQRGSGGVTSKIRRTQSRDQILPPPSPKKRKPRRNPNIKKQKRVKRSRYDILGNLK